MYTHTFIHLYHIHCICVVYIYILTHLDIYITYTLCMCIHTHIHAHTHTSGPQITSFCSTSFHYNIDEKEKILPSWSHSLCGDCVVLSCIHGFFLGTHFFPHSLKQYTFGELACLHFHSLSVCGGGGEWPCDRRASCPGLGPTLCPELPE